MNGKTIVALYDDLSSAERVLGELETAGLRHDFTMMGADTAKLGASDKVDATTGWRHAATFSDAEFGSREHRVSALTRMGVTRDDAEVFAEGVRRGGVLLVGRVEDDRCDEALGIVERHGPVDIEHRGRSYREAGWTGYDTTAHDYDETQAGEERTRWSTGTGTGTGLGAAATSFRDTNVSGTNVSGTNVSDTGRTVETDATRARADLNVNRADTGREEHIPIIEEELHVGKRAVERGSVRVRSYVIETPVEEQVRLRDESVIVERHAVDRDVSDLPPDAFRERIIEVSETDEEPVVQKTAHVREEVVIRKEAEERAQTISDTVRRTEVEIDDNRTGGDRPLDRDRPASDRPLDRDRDPDRGV